MTSVQAILEGILAGTLGLQESLPALSPHVAARFTGNYRQFRTVGAVSGLVPLRASMLMPVLNSYLSGTMSAHAVSEWASFILAVDAYALPDSPDSELPYSEAEAIREVLWSLSSAPFSSAVTEATVRQQVARLNAFSPGTPRRS